jgi:hypothetical protein
MRRIGWIGACIAAGGFAQFPFPPPPGGGPGFGGVRQDMKLVRQFDQDGDKRLNAAERKAAREHLATQPRRGPMGMFRGGQGQQPVERGRKLTPADVKSYGSESLYDMKTLRTLFLDFDNADWEKELADFYHTDVEVPATLTVDGKTYRNVGVRFRGATSYFTVGEGRKKPLNLTMDFIDKQQRLGGYRTLNLLNAHSDPTYLRSVLYLQIMRDSIGAPKANYVRVVINGESWGVYVNVQQFNADSVKEWTGSVGGARWKVPGSPMGRGGLSYLGEDPEPYKRIYEIKTRDDANSWAALIRLCKVLNQTPPAELEKAIEPLLDVDGTLKYLALEKALINNDGYWTRASDYNIYQDGKGRFHLAPHDTNETFRTPEGPGMRTAGGVELDPFAGAEDPNKPLLNKLLAVPSLRARYLAYLKDVAERWLKWDRIEGLARQYQELIAADVKEDTHKLDSWENFSKAVTEDVAVSRPPGGPGGPGEGPGFGPPGGPGGFRGPGGPRGFGPPPGGPGGMFGRPAISIKSFVEKRREFLLKYRDHGNGVPP